MLKQYSLNLMLNRKMKKKEKNWADLLLVLCQARVKGW